MENKREYTEKMYENDVAYIKICIHDLQKRTRVMNNKLDLLLKELDNLIRECKEV